MQLITTPPPGLARPVWGKVGVSALEKGRGVSAGCRIYHGNSCRWTPEKYVQDNPEHTRLSLGSAARGLQYHPAGVPRSALAHPHYAPHGLHTRDPRGVPSRPRLGIARRTDHLVTNVLAGNGLGDDPPRYTRRRHPSSKLGFTTAVCIPLFDFKSIGDLSRVGKGLSDHTLFVHEA